MKLSPLSFATCAVVLLLATGQCFALTAADHKRFIAESAEYARADKELNAAWKKLRAKLDAEQYRQAQAEQRLWIENLRDAEALRLGGANAQGYARATARRAAQLRSLLAAPQAAPQPDAQRDSVSVRTVPLVAPVTHVILPVTHAKAGAKKEDGAQTAATHEVAPRPGSPAPQIHTPAPAAQSPAPPAATTMAGLDDEIPPLAKPVPVRVNTAEALGPPKTPKDAGQATSQTAPPPKKPDAYTGLPRDFLHAGTRYVRLDNEDGTALLTIGAWNALSAPVQDCLREAILGGKQVEMKGNTHSFGDGSITMQEDAAMTCKIR